MSIARNTAVMLVGTAVPILVTIVTVPAFIHTIGQERYGIMAVVWAVLAIFGQVDLGSGALIQRFASRAGDPRERIDFYIASLTINICMGLAVGALIWLGFETLMRHMSFSDRSLEHQLLQSRTIVAAYLPILAVRSLNSSVLMATGRFQSTSALGSAESTLSALVPLGVAAFFTLNIVWLIGSILLVRAAFLALSTMAILPSLRGARRGRLRWSCVKSTLIFGAWAVLTGIIGSLISTADRFIVGNLSGVVAVPYLAVPSNLYSQIAQVPRALGTVLFPRFSAIADETQKIELAHRSINVMSTVMAPILVAAILLIEPVFDFWLSSTFAAKASTTAQLLFLGQFATSGSRVSSSLLLGKNRPDLLVKALMIEAVPYAVLLYGLVNAFGVVGAGWAFMIRAYADLLLLAGFCGLFRQTVVNLARGLPQLIVAFCVAAFLPMDNPIRWILAGFLLVLVSFRTALYMPEELVRLVAKLPVIRRFPFGVLASGLAVPRTAV